MAMITDTKLTQEETTAILMQALGLLLSEFQRTRKVTHLSFDFMGFTWKTGVTENGIIDLEKHELEEHVATPIVKPQPKKLVTLEEFANGE